MYRYNNTQKETYAFPTHDNKLELIPSIVYQNINNDKPQIPVQT